MSKDPCTFCGGGAKYVCPRCGVPYCSLACYQSSRHLSCSEGFYRQCVEESLRTEQLDPAARRRVQEALARDAEQRDADREELDSDDSDSEAELAERLRDVQLDDAEAVWSRLTAAERDEFRRQAEAGAIVCERWQPWWTLRGTRPKVTELGREEAPAFAAAAPPLLTGVPPLATLTKQPPSPLVVHSLVNVLYVYAYLRLLYDGDWAGVALEVADGARLLSGCLARGETPDSGRAAVAAAELSACGSAWQADEPLRRQARAGVQHLLAGPGPDDAGWYVLAALSDLWRLLDTALEELRAGGRGGRPDQPPAAAAAGGGSSFAEAFRPAAAPVTVTRADLKRMKKKLEYLFVWSQSHQDVISEKARGPKVDSDIVIPSVSGD